jgi:hypothetical protein
LGANQNEQNPTHNDHRQATGYSKNRPTSNTLPSEAFTRSCTYNAANNNEFNFDTTLRSILTLFCLQSTEGWVDNMWAEVDTTERYGQPKMNNKPFYIIFGIFIEILINLLFLNLFVGVVIETFNQEKEKINKNNLLVY